MPHFDEIPEAMLTPMHFLTGKELTLLGIEGNTALVQNDGRYEVLGSGGVTVWNKAGKSRFTQGQLPYRDPGK